MKKTIAVVIAALFVATIASAQDVQPVVKAGARSMNFTFGGLGSFGLGAAGVNGGISGSYFMNQDAALRVGLQVYSYSTKTPWNDFTVGGTNPGSDGTTSTFALGLDVDYLMYINAMTPRVRPYWGAGIRVIDQSSDSKPGIANSSPNGTLTETKNGTTADGLSFGLAGFMGAEFFLYPEISVSAEYQLNLISITSRSDMVTSYKGSPSVTSKQGSATTILGFGSAGATLHIYF
jgi:opacity protein-like surface antigen